MSLSVLIYYTRNLGFREVKETAKATQQGALSALIRTWKFLAPRLMLRLLGHSLKKNF